MKTQKLQFALTSPYDSQKASKSDNKSKQKNTNRYLNPLNSLPIAFYKKKKKETKKKKKGENS